MFIYLEMLVGWRLLDARALLQALPCPYPGTPPDYSHPVGANII